MISAKNTPCLSGINASNAMSGIFLLVKKNTLVKKSIRSSDWLEKTHDKKLSRRWQKNYFDIFFNQKYI